MNKFRQFAKVAFHPYSLLLLTSISTFKTKLNKTHSEDETVHNILKEDVINVYNESIDEKQKQPLIDLLKRKSNDLDPELKKRLELYAEWQKDSDWTLLYKYIPTVAPVYFSVSYFPYLSVVAMLTYGIATGITFDNEREIITGGKMKSYFAKNLVPKQQRIEQVFMMVGYGLVALSFAKLGLSKYELKMNKRIISEWKQRNQK